MQTLSKNNIIKIVNDLRSQKNENLEPFIGSGENKQLILSPGLKIKHTDSGIVYTINDIHADDSEIKLACSHGSQDVVIPSEEFKHYERQ